MKHLKFILLVVLLIGCGTRKRAMKLDKVEIKEIREIISKTNTNTTANVKLTKEYSLIKLEPIDPNQESEYNGQKFKNTKIILDTSKTDSVSFVTDNSKKEVSENTNVDVKTKNKDVKVETKKPNPYLWAGLTLLFLFLAYLGYRHLKR